MGNCCCCIRKKSTVEIEPSDFIKGSQATPVVKLYGSPKNPLTSYIRFALLYKPVTLHFVPSESPKFGSDAPVIQIGSESVSGPRETLLQYIESRFPEPPLLRSRSWVDETTPLIVSAATLQHRSMVWHLERMVRWADDLATRGGNSRGDPVMGTPQMEVKKFAKSYSQLFELMLEHAQMEERIVFPIMEKADRGSCKAANVEHARDLPIMNGIKEDIKSIAVLQSGAPLYQEALCSVAARLKTLQEHCKEHFGEEESELLPLMEATELSREEHKRVIERCLDVMQETHSHHLFSFFLQGLKPVEALHYLDIVTICSTDKQRIAALLHMIF